ncbi:Cu/Ag efflux pump CusA [Bradyrhizobium sp. LM3.2]
MIEYILAASVRRRWLVLLVTLAAALSGAWSLTKLPIDAVPDVTNVQVQVNALAPALSPIEISRNRSPFQSKRRSPARPVWN